jgi:phosphate starvation-inducible protein PhoH
MVFTGNAFAGAGKKALKNSGRPAVLERMHRVLEKMDLDANQTAKISAILDQAETQLQALHAQSKSGDKSAAKGQAKSLLIRTRTDIVEQLTPQQSQTFQNEFRINKRGGVKSK